MQSLLQGKFGPPPTVIVGMAFSAIMQRLLLARGLIALQVGLSSSHFPQAPCYQGEVCDVLHLTVWDEGYFYPNCWPTGKADKLFLVDKVLDGRAFFGASTVGLCISAPVLRCFTENTDGLVADILGRPPTEVFLTTEMGDTDCKRICAWTRGAADITACFPAAASASFAWHQESRGKPDAGETRADWDRFPRTAVAVVVAMARGPAVRPPPPYHSDVVELAAARLHDAGFRVPLGYANADARPDLSVGRDYMRQHRGAMDPLMLVMPGVVPRLVAARSDATVRDTNDRLFERLGSKTTYRMQKSEGSAISLRDIALKAPSRLESIARRLRRSLGMAKKSPLQKMEPPAPAAAPTREEPDPGWRVDTEPDTDVIHGPRKDTGASPLAPTLPPMHPKQPQGTAPHKPGPTCAETVPCMADASLSRTYVRRSQACGLMAEGRLALPNLSAGASPSPPHPKARNDPQAPRLMCRAPPVLRRCHVWQAPYDPVLKSLMDCRVKLKAWEQTRKCARSR